MAVLNLLPRKEFEITTDSGEVVKGQYALWSVKRFCDRKGLTLSKLADAMSEANVTFDDVTLLILCAVEYSCRKEKKPFTYTDIDCCDWIEQLGGLESENFANLQKHAASEDKGEDEKKNQI